MSTKTDKKLRKSLSERCSTCEHWDRQKIATSSTLVIPVVITPRYRDCHFCTIKRNYTKYSSYCTNYQKSNQKV